MGFSRREYRVKCRNAVLRAALAALVLPVCLAAAGAVGAAVRPDGVVRFAGADRYAIAVEISGGSFTTTATDVFVVTGQNWPDAPSAGAAAAQLDAPVLPFTTDAVPATVSAELDRLSRSARG